MKRALWIATVILALAACGPGRHHAAAQVKPGSALIASPSPMIFQTASSTADVAAPYYGSPTPSPLRSPMSNPSADSQRLEMPMAPAVQSIATPAAPSAFYSESPGFKGNIH